MMKGSVDYWLGQLLSLIFYIMTIIVYNRARKEYVGGKIADAINLIMVFLAILLLADFTDYFLVNLIPLEKDIITILKVLLKLTAICVLFFGGLRFFSTRPDADVIEEPDLLRAVETAFPEQIGEAVDADAKATVVLEETSEKRKPKLGRYEIIEQIGKGAMGIVYKGKDPKLNRLTAVKTIRFMDEFDEDKADQIKMQFYREAEVVAKLSHRNIVTVFDVGEDLDLSYLAMEYLEGESLDRFTSKDNLLPVETCIQYIIQVCDALDYAHQQGVIHRDIKPGNIMVLKDGLVKVMDFGIARAAGGTKTQTGIIKGTPFYMSPEQAKGEELTGASDIFSLGVLFYQLLTGELPFSGENLASIMYQTANVDPKPADTYNPNLDTSILTILNKALEKKPEDRFGSAKEMAEKLRQIAGRAAYDSTLEADAAVFDREELIDATDSKALFQNGSVPPADKGEKDVGEIRNEMEAGAYIDAVESYKGTEKRGKVDLSELREVIAAEKRRIEREGDHPVSESTGGVDAFQKVTAVKTDIPEKRDQLDTVYEDEPERWGKKNFLNVFERDKTLIYRYGFPIAYAAIALILLGGAYYYFWKSPRADTRVLKLVYYRYFESEEQKKKDMLEEQKRLVQEIMRKKLQKKQSLARAQAEKKNEQVEKEKKEEEKIRESMRLAREKIEAEKKKQEEERHARIAEERQKEKERRERMEAQKRKEAERLERIAEEKRREKEKQERLAAARTEAAIQEEIAAVESIISTAEKHLAGEEYLTAKKRYESALSVVEQSAYKEDLRLRRYLKTIQSALSQDSIVYGLKGYIRYKDQWMPPEEYEALRYKEGFVKYQGEFRDYRTLSKIIRSKTEPLVDNCVTAKYSDVVVHKKDIKFQKVDLIENSSVSSSYSVLYRWEVWTFKQGRSEGVCTVEIAYNVEKNQWSLIKDCQ